MLLCAAFGAFPVTIIIAQFCKCSKYVTFSTIFGALVRESILCAVWRAQRQSWNMFKIRGITCTSSYPREQPRGGVFRFTANFRGYTPGDIAPPGRRAALEVIHGIAWNMTIPAQDAQARPCETILHFTRIVAHRSSHISNKTNKPRGVSPELNSDTPIPRNRHRPPPLLQRTETTTRGAALLSPRN